MKIADLEVEIVKKDIKNIHLGVHPPQGRIRVAAPKKLDNETIKLFVISKTAWIKKQCNKFNEQRRQTKREYVSGETHFLKGKKYRLNVVSIKNSSKVEINKRTHIDLLIKSNYTSEKKEKLMNQFYRTEFKKLLPELIEKWEKIANVKVDSVKIRKMKTKWGTSNPKNKSLTLNLELIKYPIHCIEYVIVHEMTHFLEKNHTKRFYLLLTSFLPQWKQYKSELDNSLLGYFEWKY